MRHIYIIQYRAAVRRGIADLHYGEAKTGMIDDTKKEDLSGSHSRLGLQGSRMRHFTSRRNHTNLGRKLEKGNAARFYA